MIPASVTCWRWRRIRGCGEDLFSVPPWRIYGRYRVARAAVPLLVDAFGCERLIWGSDWPHTHFTDTMNFAGAVEILHAIVPDREQRETILGSRQKAVPDPLAHDTTP